MFDNRVCKIISIESIEDILFFFDKSASYEKYSLVYDDNSSSETSYLIVNPLILVTDSVR